LNALSDTLSHASGDRTHDRDDLFDYRICPDNPGWHQWTLRDAHRFNSFLGKILVQSHSEEAGNESALVRMFPDVQHSNLLDAVHGGAILGFIDVALFAACYHLDALSTGPSVTLDLSSQFMAPARLNAPLDAQIDVLRSTRRLVFLRGLVVQGDARICAFSATIRKAA
jgi:uncharacterized protein (TIGR00369 family)